MIDDEFSWRVWGEAHQAWLAERRRPSTARAYRLAVREFFEWAGVPPWAVTPALAKDWADHLAAGGRVARTVQLKLSALSSFYRFASATARPWPAYNPFAPVQRPRVSPYRRSPLPSTQEVMAMLTAINPGRLVGARDFALLATLLVTGARAGPVLAMRWGDLEAVDDGSYVWESPGRGGRSQTLALSRASFRAICAYLERAGRPPECMRESDYIFVPLNPGRVRHLPGRPRAVTPPARPLSSSFVNRILKKYARQVGVDPRKANLRGLRRAAARPVLRVWVDNWVAGWIPD